MDLIISSFGASLSRDNDGFVVTTSDGKQRLPSAGVKGIQLGKGTQITSDAVMLAVEKEIDIVIVDKGGSPVARIWSPKYGSISTIRRGQVNFIYTRDSVDWIKDIICKKIENQQALLLMLSAESDSQTNAVKTAVRRLEDYRCKVEALEGEVVYDIAPTLRGWEGVASKIYFECVNLFLPESCRFEKRSQHPAMDVANAMLNYGYGVLYGKIEGAMIKSGIDPYAGVMHRDDYNRPVLAYDVIEIYRIWVDYVVFSLLVQDIITDEYYSVREDGSCWLEALGRRILIQSLNDFMEETVENGELQRSRVTQMNLYIQKLAQKFKNYV